MKVYFDHITGFGKIKHMDFIFSNPYGVLEPNESEEDVIKEGWILWEDYWYNLRSVRLDLNEYKPAKTTKKLSKYVTIEHGDVLANLEQYEELYDKYCKYHGFKRDINLASFKDCNVIEYHTDLLIGISLYRVFNKQFVAYEFIWDYKDPKLSLGTIAQMMECETAKLLNCEYVYLLGGYEKCCEYKANYSGFEFWTGKEWSTDVELYKTLVARDENINITGYDV
jgi:arginyl-tRNA--protein-N-Asp/Glu arginylyltransferase